jgi:ribosome maturation factor RimP
MTPESTVALEAVVEPVVATLGYELVHVEWVGSGPQRRLRVYLDHDQGITLADCVRMSPIISNALDAAESVGATGPDGSDLGAAEIAQQLRAPYTLEVSSPGLDRPLRRRSHFARFVGHRVTVQTMAPLDPDSRQRTFHGRIEEVQSDPGRPDDDRSGVVVLHADDDHHHAIPLALIRRANLVIEV